MLLVYTPLADVLRKQAKESAELGICASSYAIREFTDYCASICCWIKTPASASQRNEQWRWELLCTVTYRTLSGEVCDIYTKRLETTDFFIPRPKQREVLYLPSRICDDDPHEQNPWNMKAIQYFGWNRTDLRLRIADAELCSFSKASGYNTKRACNNETHATWMFRPERTNIARLIPWQPVAFTATADLANRLLVCVSHQLRIVYPMSEQLEIIASRLGMECVFQNAASQLPLPSQPKTEQRGSAPIPSQAPPE